MPIDNKETQIKTTKVYKTFHVLKDIQSINEKPDKPGCWALASVEVEDTEGDIIKIDGIDWSSYHNPEKNVYMKVLANHMTVLPDGSSPVIGRVEEFKKVTLLGDTNAKALALECHGQKQS